MSTNPILAQVDSGVAPAADSLRAPGGPLETVRLFLRHPHFDADSFVQLDENVEEPPKTLQKARAKERRAS